MNIRVVGTGSSGNSYILEEDNGKKIILDLGMTFKEIKKSINFEVGAIQFALVTHEHKDHCLSVIDLLDAGIPVLSSFAVRRKTDKRVIPLTAGTRYQMPGGYKIIPFNVPHTSLNGSEIVPCDNLGFFMEFPNHERMVYATDFEYIPFNFKNQKIGHWLIECNHMDFDGINPERRSHVLKGHSSLETVLDIVEQNWTYLMRNIILCHLSETNADPVEMQRQVKELAGPTVTVSVARAGETINLSPVYFPMDGETEEE